MPSQKMQRTMNDVNDVDSSCRYELQNECPTNQLWWQPWPRCHKHELITRMTTKHTFRPPQDDHPSTPTILLPTILKRYIAACGLNKRNNDPAPIPRYPTQRLAPHKTLLTWRLRMLWVSFLYFMLEKFEREMENLQSWEWLVWDWNS